MRVLPILLLVLPLPLAGQQVPPSHEALREIARLVDVQRGLAEARAAAHGYGETTEATYRQIVGDLVPFLDAARRRNTPRHGLRRVGPHVLAFNQAVDAVFHDDPPDPVLDARNAIDAMLRGAASLDLDEYERRFSIRYGPLSQRLNLIEIVADNLLNGSAVGPDIRDPVPVELVLRIDPTTFQYDAELNDLDTSYPVALAGFTYYLYADNAVAGFLNHVGIAAAGLRDWRRGEWYAGAMVHARRVHAGYLVNTRDAARSRLVASFNVQLVRGIL